MSRLGSQAYWWCQCQCGCGSERKSVNGSSLRRGISKSCGTEHKRATSEAKRTHGRTGTYEYRTWLAMKKRCLDANDSGYYKYGARGITVCERWLLSFEAFFEDMGEKPSKIHSIDRINNGGNYEPGNCRWATPKEQARNRRSTRMYTYNGETLCLTDWCVRLGLNKKTVMTRIHQGKKTIGQALGLE